MKTETYIKKHYATKTREEIAQNLKTNIRVVAIKFAWLKRKNVIPTNAVLKASKELTNYNNIVKTAPKKEGMFNNVAGAGKEQARDIMVKAILKYIVNGIILSLPFEKCIIEKIILEHTKKFTFLGCEWDNNFYNNMLRTIAEFNLPISTHRGSISEIIERATQNQFAHLILDYCGQLGTTHKDIENAILNDIMQVGGAMCITLNKRIAPGTETIYNLMEQLNPITDKNGETRCEHSLRTLINRIGGKKYAIEGDPFNYNDGSSMVLMIVRRIA